MTGSSATGGFWAAGLLPVPGLGEGLPVGLEGVGVGLVSSTSGTLPVGSGSVWTTSSCGGIGMGSRSTTRGGLGLMIGASNTSGSPFPGRFLSIPPFSPAQAPTKHRKTKRTVHFPTLPPKPSRFMMLSFFRCELNIRKNFQYSNGVSPLAEKTRSKTKNTRLYDTHNR